MLTTLAVVPLVVVVAIAGVLGNDFEAGLANLETVTEK